MHLLRFFVLVRQLNSSDNAVSGGGKMRAKQMGMAVGLIIGFAAGVAHAAQSPVTFSKNVAPIFYSHCVECHRPTLFAPMSLLTYEDARPWARAIKQRVLSREMPPWGADPAIGHFRN